MGGGEWRGTGREAVSRPRTAALALHASHGSGRRRLRTSAITKHMTTILCISRFNFAELDGNMVKAGGYIISKRAVRVSGTSPGTRHVKPCGILSLHEIKSTDAPISAQVSF